MRLVIRPDYDAVSDWVAAFVRHRINDFRPTAQRPFVLGLPTGQSPLGTYQRLVAYHKNGELSFKNVVTFNMDEYVGLPATHPQSYHTFMWDNLFALVDIPLENTNIPDGNAPDLAEECRRYERSIAEVGGVDLFLGGIGTDGHIAFNEPGSSLTSRTRVKTLARETIAANSRFFDDTSDGPPKSALTIGVGTFMDAREVLIIVCGLAKAHALYNAIECGVSHMWTVSMIQMHPRALVVCDDDATADLQVKTVRYFKGLDEALVDSGQRFPAALP